MKIIKLKYGKRTNKIFYRGQSKTEDIGAYWTESRKTAEEYSKLRKGNIIMAELRPEIAVIGEEPELARYLGIYKEYINLRVNDDFRGASRLVANNALKKGIDARVDDNQVVMFNKSKIHVLNGKKPILISQRPPRITPKPPRITPKPPRITPKTPRIR